MQHVVGDATVAEANAAPTKRTRRPSVRLHEPYYENLPGQRKMQRQLNPIRSHSGGTKKPRTLRTVHPKNKKNDGASDASKGENLNFDGDDVVIGNWKTLDSSNRDRDFKRKRVRPSGSNKCDSTKSRRIEDQNFSLSSGGESEKQEDYREEYKEDGYNSNLVVDNTDVSSPNCSFGNDDDDDDDGNEKLSDENGNIGMNQGREKMGLKNTPDSNETGDMNRHGVRAWLNELGLDKYAALFEVHEVDDEVLAQLTLEDLKDMGISAVGTRRKMYSSIQKLGKGFS